MRYRSVWLAAAALSVLLAVAHTWPLATAPATLSRNDNGDAQLNAWILAWVAHQLPRDPLHLFDANIFHPERDTLAFSEPLIVPAVLGAPVAWLGGSPVLVYNLMMMLGFALTAFAGFTLMYRWTGDRTASMLTGSMLAFNTHTLTRLAHVQALHLYGLPLALLSLDRMIAAPRLRDALWLAVWMTVLAYTSGYLVVFAAVMIAVAVLVRAPEWRHHARRFVSMLGVATIVSAVLVVPLSIPYRRVARDQGMVRSLEAVSEYTASPKGYLASAGTIHISTWSGRFFRDPIDSFFPGFVVVGLSAVALVYALRRREGAGRARVVMLVAIAATGFVLSLGPKTPVYGWLFAVFPPMQGLRAAARFGNLFLLATAALAGLGLASLRARQSGVFRHSAVAIALVAAANIESLRAPFQYREFQGIPHVYDLLAQEPGPVVLAEVPYYLRDAIFENAEYVLNSAAHWRPLMNGYSGYTPRSYDKYAPLIWYFPDQRAIDALRAAGVTHVMVHPYRFGHGADEMLAEVDRRPELELIATGGRARQRLYRLKPVP
jgi:hypothetical protein